MVNSTSTFHIPQFEGCFYILLNPRDSYDMMKHLLPSGYMGPSTSSFHAYIERPTFSHVHNFAKCKPLITIDQLLHRVQRIMHDNVMTHRFMNVVFTKIDFVIQKDLAVQLVACLPSIHV
ncbi:hypothetical protein MTR_3g101880 [Medicago truncatula]|uniref:Uncharacterized protein n=1 Tax=Medicago truncatula TaxID=3880 RepID=G7J6F3_MEDTR|nr:hypothetical protein MTR_3g101880 [Medicago truncatula]